MKKASLITALLRIFSTLMVISVGLFAIIGSATNPKPKISWEALASSRENAVFKATLIPNGSPDYGFDSFNLIIQNKINRDIELIWDKTLYITNGQTSGGFMFEGVVYKDRNAPKPPDIIFPQKRFSKIIYPSNLADYLSGKGGGWFNRFMEAGEHGVYLSIKANGLEINEKILISISATKTL